MTKKRSPKTAAHRESPKALNPKLKYLLPLVLLILLPLQALTSVVWKSAAVEEAVHLAAGAHHLLTHEMEAFPGFLPVFRMWAALPLLLSDVKMPAVDPAADEIFPFSYGAQFLYTQNDADRFLFLGRAMIVMLALLLGFYLFRFSKEHFGWNAAAVSLFAYVFCPNILAHSRLITPDIPLTAFFFIAVYYFRKSVVNGSKGSAVLAALFGFLSIDTKHSGLLLFPALLLWIMGIYLIGRRRSSSRPVRVPSISVRRSLKTLLFMVVVSVILVNAQYGFRGFLGNLKAHHHRFGKPIESHLFRRAAQLPIVSGIPLPFPRYYLRNLDIAVFNDRDAGHPNWYLGKLHPKGESWWHYYFVATGLKVPIPGLIALLLTLIAGIGLARKNPGRLEPVLYLLIPALVFFIFYSGFCRTQLGLRLILPAFPFLYVAMGWMVQAASEKSRRLHIILAILLAGWYLLASVRTFPHYLSYFNGLAGGPKGGIHFFADSNLDWGQDLKGLKKYMEKKKIEKINLIYYGPYGKPELDYYGIRLNDPAVAPNAPWAVSATWRYYADLEPIKSAVPFSLKTRLPDDMIGHTIYIYYPR